MSRRAPVLCKWQLERIKTRGMYAVGTVSGLYLLWRSPKAKSWILRTPFPFRSKCRKDFGLGPYPEVTLAKATETAKQYKEWISQGLHPKEQEERIAATNIAESEARFTFEVAAEKCWKIQKAQFTSAKHADQWIRTIRDYANPVLGKMYVEDITRADVVKVLEPIWQRITDTASKLRGRIETVIGYYYALRNIDRRNPAAWEDGLDKVLPSAQALISQQDEHHPALPWKRMPELLSRLATKKGFGARALEWQIQTTSRGIEVRGAQWQEIDWEKKEWKVPGRRMKNKRPHRVPLNDAQLEWLRALPRMDDCNLIFPSSKRTMISDATIGKVLKDFHEADIKAAQKSGMTKEQIDVAVNAGRIGFVDPEQDYRVATPHGTARSSFKDWVRNCIGHRFADEVSELCIAHVNNDATRAAYARDELIDLRRLMLDEWISFIRTPHFERPAESANSATLQRSASAAA
jgi:integrase